MITHGRSVSRYASSAHESPCRSPTTLCIGPQSHRTPRESRSKPKSLNVSHPWLRGLPWRMLSARGNEGTRVLPPLPFPCPRCKNSPLTISCCGGGARATRQRATPGKGTPIVTCLTQLTHPLGDTKAGEPSAGTLPLAPPRSYLFLGAEDRNGLRRRAPRVLPRSSGPSPGDNRLVRRYIPRAETPRSRRHQS